jgi:hypothetical protein
MPLCLDWNTGECLYVPFRLLLAKMGKSSRYNHATILRYMMTTTVGRIILQWRMPLFCCYKSIATTTTTMKLLARWFVIVGYFLAGCLCHRRTIGKSVDKKMTTQNVPKSSLAKQYNITSTLHSAHIVSYVLPF